MAPAACASSRRAFCKHANVLQRVTAVGVDSGYEAQGMGGTVATARGFTVGRARSVGKGHVFVWGDEWITYDSEWTDHPDYQVQLFWLNSIKWLTLAGQCQVAIPPNPPI